MVAAGITPQIAQAALHPSLRIVNANPVPQDRAELLPSPPVVDATALATATAMRNTGTAVGRMG
jgi:hypothetical protein